MWRFVFCEASETAFGFMWKLKSPLELEEKNNDHGY